MNVVFKKGIIYEDNGENGIHVPAKSPNNLAALV